MNTDTGNKLLEAITTDVEKETQGIIQKAQESADQELKRATTQAKQIREHLLADSQSQIERVEKKIFSKLNLEKKKIILNEQEKLIQEVFTLIYQSIQKLHKSASYQDMLKNLTVHSIMVLAESEALIIANKQDIPLLDKAFIRSCQQELRSLEHTVTIHISDTTFHTATGITVQTADGRKAYDNTLENKVRRYKGEIRLFVSKMLFENED